MELATNIHHVDRHCKVRRERSVEVMLHVYWHKHMFLLRGVEGQWLMLTCTFLHVIDRVHKQQQEHDNSYHDVLCQGCWCCNCYCS